MIPKIVHFIFGLKSDFGGKGFSYIHYLSIMSAFHKIRPEAIFFYYQYEPNGFWWDKAKKYVTLVKVIAPDNIFGNELRAFQHKADVLRLEILKNVGGIYLDIDVLTFKSFDNLLSYKNVMGIEPSVGLCNAVILSEKNSLFINEWYNSYKSFDRSNWNHHSIQVPFLIAKKHPEDVHIESYYSFYFPFYKDTAQCYLWGEKINYNKHFISFMKNLLLKVYSLSINNCKYFPILTQFNNANWHFNKLNKSYCIHLWEFYWWDKYMKNLSPSDISIESNSLFCKIVAMLFTHNQIWGL